MPTRRVTRTGRAAASLRAKGGSSTGGPNISQRREEPARRYVQVHRIPGRHARFRIPVWVPLDKITPQEKEILATSRISDEETHGGAQNEPTRTGAETEAEADDNHEKHNHNDKHNNHDHHDQKEYHEHDTHDQKDNPQENDETREPSAKRTKLMPSEEIERLEIGPICGTTTTHIITTETTTHDETFQ